MTEAILIPAGGVTFLALLAWTLRGRKALFWLAFLPAFLPIEYIDRYHVELPGAVRWMPFVCMLFAGVASVILLPRVHVRFPRGVSLAFVVMCLGSIGSMLLNPGSFVPFLVAQKSWIAGIACFVALKSVYGILDREQIIAMFVRAGMISCVLCVFQRVFLVPLTAGEDAGDRVVGLFSVGYIALFFHLFCSGMVLSYWLKGRRIVRTHPGIVLFMFVGAMAVANQKAAILFLAIVMAYVVMRSGARVIARNIGKLSLALTVLPVFMVAVFASIYDTSYGRNEKYTEAMVSRDYVERYVFGDESTNLTSSGTLRRGAALVVAWEEIKSSKLLFGYGPGATANSKLPGAQGRLARRYPDQNINRLSLSMILGDTGLVGVTLHLIFLFSVAWLGVRNRDREPTELSRAREIFVIISICMSVYGNLLNEPIYLLVLAVMLYPSLGLGTQGRARSGVAKSTSSAGSALG